MANVKKMGLNFLCAWDFLPIFDTLRPSPTLTVKFKPKMH